MSLKAREILDGYPDGAFRPLAGINRAEFMKILVAGFRPDSLREEAGCFTDVADAWFARYVCAAKRLRWVDGYPDGSFGPEKFINRAEAMKILVDAFGGNIVWNADRMPQDVRADAWFHLYVAAGVELGIVDPSVRFRPGSALTREDAAIWLAGVGE